jgi:pyruvate dehydrogenase E2 component (dihydrolipoamide acetyltransferase)
MTTPIAMPKQGQSVETCVLQEWKKKKGDPVKQGEVLFTYETDKASFEFESPAAGVLLETFFDPQDDVPVHTVVAVVGEPGDETGQFRPVKNRPRPAGESARSSAQPQAQVLAVPAFTAGAATAGTGAASPRARRKAEERGIDLSRVTGSGPAGRTIERDVLAQPALTRTAARRRIAEDLPVPDGSGLRNARIRSADLVKAPPQDAPAAGDAAAEIPLSTMRKIIGSRMLHSLQQSAQLTMNAFADATALLACRKRFKTRNEEITITDMIAMAAARTLTAHPELNALYQDGKLLRYCHVHLAVAVDTPRGLMVPVVRCADRLTLEGLSAKFRELASQCRAGSINPDLLAGGTVTLSNLGMFGIESFTPILNPPQVAILGVNAIAPRPVTTAVDGTAVRPHIGFSLTIDHRVVDGAPGARFLKALCGAVAAIDSMLAVWK